MMSATLPDSFGPPTEPVRRRQLTAGLSFRLTLIRHAPDERQAVVGLLQRWAETAPNSIRLLSLAPDGADASQLVARLEVLVAGDGRSYAPGRSPDERLTDLINGLMTCPEDLAVVLIGVSLVAPPGATKLLERFVDYLPPHVHLYLVDTAMPPLANMARLRVRRQLLEIDWRGGMPPRPWAEQP